MVYKFNVDRNGDQLYHLLNTIKLDSFLGSGPEGADDLCFHTGDISPSSSPPSSMYPPLGQIPSLEAQIPALRLKS